VIGLVRVFPPEVTVCVVTTRENDVTVEVCAEFVEELVTTLAVTVFGFVVVTVLTVDVLILEVEFKFKVLGVLVSVELLQLFGVWLGILLFEMT
jgi:hypothetical protein